ncbi:hypothetical protein MKX01_033054 [Papaver californicum]|nr:hypothetical protein MKX01_033054 [Papaver californicum]
MATTVSAWAKPGAWALEAEENDAAEVLIQQQEKEKEKSKIFQFRHQQKEEQQPLSDFPSLSAAVAAKTKKKKAVPISLSEFQTGSSINKNSSSQPAAKGLTTDELLSLPTGPRERTSEELERGSGRLGGGFRSYGNNREGGSDESRGGRSGGFNRDRENTRDSGPSRADESGDWGAKKSMGAPSFERRERGSGGGFFDSQSRADETEDWGAAKRSGGAPFERRERSAGGGFPDTGSRADESDSWVSNKSWVSSMPPPRRVGGGFERERREGFGFQKETSNGGGPDSDTWGKKREEGAPTMIGNGARPKLVLKPRTLSPTNGEEQPGSMTKTKGSNPFGEARPREEILAEKGQDYKKIDEQFDSIKIKENGSNGTGPTDGSSSFGKKSFGNGNGSETERSWRKPESVDVSPAPSAEVENGDGGVVAETETETETEIAS